MPVCWDCYQILCSIIIDKRLPSLYNSYKLVGHIFHVFWSRSSRHSTSLARLNRFCTIIIRMIHAVLSLTNPHMAFSRKDLTWLIKFQIVSLSILQWCETISKVQIHFQSISFNNIAGRNCVLSFSLPRHSNKYETMWNGHLSQNFFLLKMDYIQWRNAWNQEGTEYLNICSVRFVSRVDKY